MKNAKLQRIIKNLQCHHGTQTASHVLSTVINNNDICRLPARLISTIANIRHNAYLEGKQSQSIDTWGYNGIYDFIAGLGRPTTRPDKQGVTNAGMIVVDEDKIKIEKYGPNGEIVETRYYQKI